MKKIVFGAAVAAITAGTLVAAPLAQAEPEPDPEEPGLVSPIPFPFPIPFPRLTGEPQYGPQGTSLESPGIRSVRSAYSIPASNPTA